MPKSNPYPVQYDRTNDLLHFETDHGLTYVCSFHLLNPQLSPILGVYDITVSDMGFTSYDPSPERPKPQDERISDTLLSLMGAYLENRNTALIYVCDASDGRPHARQALFIRWHRQVADRVAHQPMTISIGEEKVYGGVFWGKDFEHPEVLKFEVIDKAPQLIWEKFER